MGEKRSVGRWQINRLAKVKVEEAEDFTSCRVNDINLKGTQISLNQKLEKDKPLKLGLALSSDFTLEVVAWVVWYKWLSGTHTHGLYFTKIDDSDKEKIYKFVYKYFPGAVHRQWWEGLEKGGEMMEKPESEDKRIFARLSADLPLRFLEPDANVEGEGNTRDISAKGIGFLANKELVPNTSLEMWLGIPDRGEPLYTRGRVIWSKMIKPNQYRTGVNLEKADLMGVSRVLRTR